MRKPKNVDLDAVRAAVESDENVGFCLACGAEHDSVEPDARQYVCQHCGRAKVYGAEEILIMCI
jgi:Zn finger protein HypA/HybF involved in hydrogenase expression